jgi:hypothetical protein
MNISESREKLNLLINDILNSYNDTIDITNNQSIIDKNMIKDLTEQINIQKKEIDDKDKIISNFNKKCYDYEQVINNYQEQMLSIEEEKKTNNKVSIVVSQANELENKDRYIDQLENKIKLIKSKNIGITESPISKDKSNNVFKSEEIDKEENEKEQEVKEDEQEVKEDEQEVKEEIQDELLDSSNINKNSTSSSDEEEITYKRITYKKVKYYIIVDQEPQYVYSIDDNGDPGESIGIRTKKNSKYVIDFN